MLQRKFFRPGFVKGKSAVPLHVKQTPEHLRKSAAAINVKRVYNREEKVADFLTSNDCTESK
jgi:hypothetical protein